MNKTKSNNRFIFVCVVAMIFIISVMISNWHGFKIIEEKKDNTTYIENVYSCCSKNITINDSMTGWQLGCSRNIHTKHYITVNLSTYTIYNSDMWCDYLNAREGEIYIRVHDVSIYVPSVGSSYIIENSSNVFIVTLDKIRINETFVLMIMEKFGMDKIIIDGSIDVQRTKEVCD